MKTTLQKKIDAFLTERRRCAGGWPPVTLDDVKQLCEIINTLIQLKFDRDPDGDLPIEYTVVDRTRFDRMSFEPVPYSIKVKTPEELQAIFDAHFFNFEVAHEALSRIYRVLRHEQQHERNKKNERG